MNTIAVVCLLSLFTVIDAGKNPCKDVTFGGCNLQRSDKVLSKKQVQTVQLCNEECYNTDNCNIYRYNNETKECTLTTNVIEGYDYISDYRTQCDIQAGPPDNDPRDCLDHIGKQICDSYLEEECEYSGELLLAEGADIDGVTACWTYCKTHSPDCKYWIYDKFERECILKRDGGKTCTALGGPKEPSYAYCKNLTMSSHAL